MAGELGRKMKRVVDSDSDAELPRDRGKGRADGVNGNASAGPSNSQTANEPAIVDDDEPGWTLDTYEPRGITGDSKTGGQFRKSAHDISVLLRSLRESVEKSGELARSIEELQEGSKMVTEIDKGVRRVLDQHQCLTIRKQVIESISARMDRGETIQHPLEEYEQEVQVKVDEWNSLSERAKFKDDELYTQFREAIWAARNGDDSECPPVEQWLEGGEGEEEDNSDDEIQMGGRTQTFRCPLTLKTYEHAVTSRKCKHSYSRDAILAVFRRASRKGPTGAKCPVPGCKEWLSKDDLVDDPRLQKKADQFAHRQATQTQADVSTAISVAGDDDEDEED